MFVRAYYSLQCKYAQTKGASPCLAHPTTSPILQLSLFLFGEQTIGENIVVQPYRALAHGVFIGAIGRIGFGSAIFFFFFYFAELSKKMILSGECFSHTLLPWTKLPKSKGTSPSSSPSVSCLQYNIRLFGHATSNAFLLLHPSLFFPKECVVFVPLCDRWEETEQDEHVLPYHNEEEKTC